MHAHRQPTLRHCTAGGTWVTGKPSTACINIVRKIELASILQRDRGTLLLACCMLRLTEPKTAPSSSLLFRTKITQTSGAHLQQDLLIFGMYLLDRTFLAPFRYWSASPPPVRLTLGDYPSMDCPRPPVGMSDSSWVFALLTAASHVKFWAISAVLRLAGRAALSAKLWSGWQVSFLHLTLHLIASISNNALCYTMHAVTLFVCPFPCVAALSPVMGRSMGTK